LVCLAPRMVLPFITAAGIRENDSPSFSGIVP
jgi:hypothetical protein